MFFLIWVSAYVIVDHPLLLPSPIQVLKAIGAILTNTSELSVIGVSLFRLFLSIILSSLLGISLGIFSGLNKQIELVVKPHVTFLKTIPILSIIVILLILFGFTYAPYIITFLMLFPLFYQAANQGVKSIDQELIDVYHLEKHNLYLGIKYLYLPLVKPYLYLAFFQSFGLGLKVLVMAEYLSQTRNSMGNALYLAKVNLAYDHVFAWSFILIIITLLVEYRVQKYQYEEN
ncbi:MAG: ABC transporter permease subunit [Acholeplasmataceae bacterium]|nr:ABC transporter permease subunit [Acholeplasmataceae bacterium]